MANTPARLVARFDGWTLWCAPLELYRGDRPVRIQEQPLQILETLVQRPGELVTREELIARLWPDSVVDFDAGLNTAVRKLRAALADDADAPKYLERVPRQGYRFIGTIERPAADPTTAPAAYPASRSPQAEPALMGSRPSRLRAGLALFAVGFFIAVVVAVSRPPATDVEAGTRPPRSVNRLAVLPFANSSPDPENAFFADGIHEELLSALGSRARDLEVISRTTMLMYGGRPAEVRALARELGATHVLEGGVRRDAGTVRVSLRLIDAIADRQVWSQSYQVSLVDAMTLQTQLAREVAGQLAVQLPAPQVRPVAEGHPGLAAGRGRRGNGA
jgi:TolB-like protein/DNA-binding winged helix-turn-helix (wHTH) protein